MLRALSNYYDCLCKQPNSGLAPEGFSKVSVSYNMVLTKSGDLKTILPYVNKVEKGKKIVDAPREEIFPFRNSKTSIFAETIDHREKYLFGLEWDKKEQKFITNEKSLLAFEKCKEENTNFLKEIDTPLVKAYITFMESWNPESEADNPIIMELGKNYSGAKFVITLEDELTKTLNSLNEVKEKWIERLSNAELPDDVQYGQCSICGEVLPLARTHNNLKGVDGGMSVGTNIVCFNESAFCSYNKEQSFNSSVSQKVMEKYTTAFNYLTSSPFHKKSLGDMTLLFWAECEDDETPYMDAFIWGGLGQKTTEENQLETDKKLNAVFDLASKGKSTELKELGIDTKTQFYILGVKPNSSRLAIKMFSHNDFGEVMKNLIKHNEDMRFSEDDRQLSLWEIEKSLKSPVSKEAINPDIIVKLLTSIINGYAYPKYMLDTVVRRARTDQDKKESGFYSVSPARARIIKACLIRQKYINEGEYNMINEESRDTAYNLGRLFALLEMIQKDSLGNVNATIKDKFFSSACTTPYLVFPKLLMLTQAHLAKLDEGKKIAREKLLQEIMGKIEEGFPKTLNTEKQGMFILGYYQQKQKFYEKVNKGE